MTFRFQRHFGPLGVLSRFSAQRMVTPPPSPRQQVYPLVDFRPLNDNPGITVSGASDPHPLSTAITSEVEVAEPFGACWRTYGD